MFNIVIVRLIRYNQECKHDLHFQESFIDEALGQLEGASLGDMLDFLSKEIIRFQVIFFLRKFKGSVLLLKCTM